MIVLLLPLRFLLVLVSPDWPEPPVEFTLVVELILDGRISLDDVQEVDDGGQPFLDDVGNALLVSYRCLKGLDYIHR